MVDTTSAEINLSEDNETMKRIVDFLSKVTVERTDNPQKFIVNYPRKPVLYNGALRASLGNFLLWYWFMSTERERALEEQAKRKEEYVS